MPSFPPAHKRVQFQGTLTQSSGGGSEIFEFGFADDSALGLEALANALGPVVSAFWESGSSDISAYATLTGVRVESVEADGKVSDSFYLGLAHREGLSDGAVCTVLTCAVTLNTATAGSHGRMVTGRFYPPGYPGVLGATIALSDLQVYANTWGSFISGCNEAGAVVSVASITGGGQVAHVTAVSADNVIDTQRRRKNHVTNVRTTMVAV